MYKTLFKTERLQIIHDYENAYLIDKFGNQIMEDEFYGDPECGLIGPNNDWAIIAGEHITVWKKGLNEKLRNDDLKWIHSLRLKNNHLVEILIDPWNKFSAIWQLNIQTMEYVKIKDFTKYRTSEFCENVEW